MNHIPADLSPLAIQRCKHCPFSCPIEEAPAHFWRSCGFKSGFDCVCKSCRSAERRAYEAANPEKVRAQRTAKREREEARLGTEAYVNRSRAYRRKHLQENPEAKQRMNQYGREWFQRNKDAVIEQRRLKRRLSRSLVRVPGLLAMRESCSIVYDRREETFSAVRSDAVLASHLVCVAQISRGYSGPVVLPPPVVSREYRNLSDWTVEFCQRKVETK